jgi:hypothetical protein
MEPAPAITELITVLQLACRPTDVAKMDAGTDQLCRLPRAWVLEHFIEAAERAIDLNDPWEFRRLLGLCDLLSPHLVRHFVDRGLDSDNPEIWETAHGYTLPTEKAS